MHFLIQSRTPDLRVAEPRYAFFSVNIGQDFTMFGPDEASVYDLSCLDLVSITSRKGNSFYVGRSRLVMGRTHNGAKPLNSMELAANFDW